MKSNVKWFFFLLALPTILQTVSIVSVWASDLKFNGWLGTKTAYSQRTGLGQIYPTNDTTGNKYTHMRGRLRFEFLSNEFAGIVWHNEIDFDFGNGAFENARGRGGGLEADTVNLETKQLYLYFTVPETNMKVKAGVTPVYDNFNSIILGSDAAGFTLDNYMRGNNLRFGAYRFWDQDTTSVSDNVNFYMLSASRELSPVTRGGLAAYWLLDGGTNGNGTLNQSEGDTRNIDGLAYLSNNSATSNAAIIPGNRIYDLASYFVGFFGERHIGDNLKLDGWGIYNFGTVNVENFSNIDINGFAANLRASTEAGNTSLSLEGLYVSGADKDTDQEFGFTNAGLYGAGANFYSRHGMMILLPDGNDWNYSSASAYNVSNVYEDRFLGVTGIFGNANFNLPGNFSGKIGLGTMVSTKKREINGNRYMGTELNSVLTYHVAPEVTFALYGAYAFTGDFYKVSDSEAAASVKGVQENSDPDDLLYSYLELKVKF